METKHKAYLAHWVSVNIDDAVSVRYFMMEPVREAVREVFYGKKYEVGPIRLFTSFINSRVYKK